MRSTYVQIVLGARPDEVELEGIFDDIGRGLSHAVRDVGRAASKAIETVDKAYVDATPQWLRKGLGAVVAPGKLVWDSVDNIAHGQRLDRAFLDAGKNQVQIFKSVAPYAQMGLSFIPGIGTGVSAAIGAGLALANGKRLTDALVAGMCGAIPGGPLVQKAAEIGLNSAVGLVQGKRWDAIALDELRKQLPGGDLAKMAFDTGLALAQGKKLQDAGMSAISGAVEKLVPNSPLAQGAFEMTKRMLAKQPLAGSTQAAMRRLEVRKPEAARLMATPRAKQLQIARVQETRAAQAMTLAASTHSSSAMPIALGTLALAAAGGGAWWWMKRDHEAR